VEAHAGLSTGASLRFRHKCLCSECPGDWVRHLPYLVKRLRVTGSLGTELAYPIVGLSLTVSHTMEPKSRHQGALVSAGGEIG
jgi:hypothetical protein